MQIHEIYVIILIDMDNWILTGSNALKNSFKYEKITSPTQVKVRITHLFLTNYDLQVYSGAIKAKYPVTLGRVAIGIVTEVGEKVYGIEKDSRVFLNSTRSCGTCYACKTGKEENCEHVKIAGCDYDGFMKDFVILDYTQVTLLPASINETRALCIEAVALAERVYDKLNLPAGAKVAVVGCSFIGSVVAQILQFHKLVPIVIDNNASNLEIAKKSGVVYTLPADDDLVTNIMDATCGSMCDAAVYTTTSKQSPNTATQIVKRNATVVIAGFTPTTAQINAYDLVDKGLVLTGVLSGYKYTEVAINLLMHGALNELAFRKEILADADIEELLKEKLSNRNVSRNKMTILKFIL